MPVEQDELFRSEVLDLAALAVAVALVALISLRITGPLRGLLALAFLTFVPGWAVVANWPSATKRSRVALSVVLSLSITAAAATTTLWLHFWRPLGLFYVEASASAVAIVFGLVRRRRTRVSSRRSTRA